MILRTHRHHQMLCSFPLLHSPSVYSWILSDWQCLIGVLGEQDSDQRKTSIPQNMDNTTLRPAQQPASVLTEIY